MTRATKILLIAMFALYVAEFLLVPFEVRRPNGLWQGLGFSFIWRPPEVTGGSVVVVHWGFVFIELIVTTFVAVLGFAGTRLRSTVSDAHFPLFATLIAYAMELLFIPYQVFWTTGKSEFWGYGLVLNPPELASVGVLVARVDYIALEMMLTTIIVFVWYFITSRKSTLSR
jgi:hypothetical protein